jgi:murein DD-endopeptidase MepM/ murein hydrolase activator NlpD
MQKRNSLVLFLLLLLVACSPEKVPEEQRESEREMESQINEKDHFGDKDVTIFDQDHESSNNHTESQKYNFPIPARIFYEKNNIILTHEFPKQGHLKGDESEIFIYNSGNTTLELLEAEMQLFVDDNKQTVISGGYEKNTFYSWKQLDSLRFGPRFSGELQIEPRHKAKLHWHYVVKDDSKNNRVQIYLKVRIQEQIQEVHKTLTKNANAIIFDGARENSNHEDANHDYFQESQPPNNLNLPFDINDIDISRKLISPFGLIRHSKDSAIGHGGIDIPLNAGDEIFAPADGTILENIPANDGRGGNNVRIEISKGEKDGEAWAFLFEHITLEDGLMEGVSINEGQLIGHSAIVQGANHMALEYLFSNLRYTRNHQCWIEFLNPSDRRLFEEKFKNLKSDPSFINSWKNANDEGYYSYRGALDTSKYPNGPSYCYPMGTDLRIAMD